MFYNNVKKGINQYKKTQIMTADKGELVNMLYVGSIKFLNTAKSAIEDKKYDLANKALVRVQRILVELMLGLNPKANEIAKNLYSLYDYMHYRLIEANVHKNNEFVDEVIELLSDLQSTWDEALKKNKIHKTDKRTYANSEGGLNIIG